MLTTIKTPLVLSLFSLTCLSGCFIQPTTVAKVSEEVSMSEQPVPSSSTIDVTRKSASHNSYTNNVLSAINFGGDDYHASNGVNFEKDINEQGLLTGTVDRILGSQDPTLYQTFVEGDFKFNKTVSNGTYELTFLFAEPADIEPGARIFDVLVNSKVELAAIDVQGMRDGKAFSALDKTVNNIVIDDEQLNIELRAIKGLPVISGLIIRKVTTQENNWQLVWQDEFDYQGRPDPKKWSFDEWPARKVNDEDQVYTSREKNVRVENGKLIIEAHKEQFDNGDYTSGRIHTLDKADLHYGKIDVKAKLPAGRGTWAAIWMLPSDPYRYSTSCQENEDWQGSTTCDAWPNSGEIDIMEHVGYDMHNVHGTVHNKAYYWINWEQRKGAINARNADSEFHVYSVEWSPEHITVLMDNTPYFSYQNEHEDWRSWPFDHPYHLILNLAIGGVWGRAGGPIDDDIFPVRMEIDYVRMYRDK